MVKIDYKATKYEILQKCFSKGIKNNQMQKVRARESGRKIVDITTKAKSSKKNKKEKKDWLYRRS